MDEFLNNLQQEVSEMEKRIDTAFEGNAETFCGPLDLEAQVWMDETDKSLGERLMNQSLANWNYVTNLTKENARKLEKTIAESEPWMLDTIKKAEYYLNHSDQICNATTRRMLRLIRQYGSVPMARDIETRRRITRLLNDMQEVFATTTIKRDGVTYRLYPELSDIMGASRDYDELLWAWKGWHNAIGPQMKEPYEELVEKMNEAARDNGYSDIGVYWQYADYDQEDIETEMDRLFDQLLPFYEQLHAYTRRKLADRYGGSVDRTGFIPAHLLGNMWAQEWNQIMDILIPFPKASLNLDVTQALKYQGYTPERMFRLAEEFFTSIGLEPMTSDFWSRSVIVRPADNRPMECHASAEEFFSQTDFRIKMCTEVAADNLQTIHHEMGHIEYFMQYRRQPTVFRTGANAAFHEAIGDTMALSAMTDTHLTAIGLVPATSAQLTANDLHEQDINFLMRMALEKIAFLPFGYIVDKWRFKVFRGEIIPDDYTSSWWRMREYYQGISSPIPRTSDDFDPGAKYHIPANVPYSRYFFSFVGQFQFHSTLCQLAGHKGPLHKCDIYRSTDAGDRLRSILSLGASRPWPDVLSEFTGQRSFRADSLLQYFGPLIKWLKAENRGLHVGWKRGAAPP